MPRLGLVIAIAVMGGPVAAQDAPGPDLDSFRQTASDWLLSGQGLPRDYRVMLMQMDSADRLHAIAYLRRLGLLTERPWSLDDLLRPAATRTEIRE